MTTATGISLQCRGCGRDEGRLLYEVRGVPVHSCVLLDDAASARRFPTGDLRLAACPGCGLVWNAAFEPQRMRYAAGYEDQQCHSPRFREYQSELIRGLIERHDLRRRAIVEIGCGQGDFLLELCQAGDNRGVGVDPACPNTSPDESVRFVPSLYGPRHADLACDAMVCRHTLEHLEDPGGLLAIMHDNLGERRQAVVFLEVPDLTRILAEGAFWDIYYEHCTYFTADALARLTRRAGFEVLSCRRVYGDQYLILEARPAARGCQGAAHAHEEHGGPRHTCEQAARFGRRVAEWIDAWKQRFDEWRRHGRRVAVWGSGSKCVAFLSALGDRAGLVETVVDINPRREGRYLAGTGHAIAAPQALRRCPPDVIVVMNALYCQEVAACLQRMEITSELVPMRASETAGGNP